MKKTYDKSYDLTEKQASNYHHMMYARRSKKNVSGVIQMNVFNALLA